MGGEYPRRPWWLGLLTALALLLVSGFIFFVLVPSSAPVSARYGLLLVPAVVASFLLGGAALGPPNNRARGALFGAATYVLTGLLIWFVAGGSIADLFTDLEALLALLTWPLGIAVHFFGN